MRAHAMCLAGIGLLSPPPPSYGVSPGALAIREAVEEVHRHLFESLSLAEGATAALSALDSLRRETARLNWDGYGAAPLDSRAFEQAVRFLTALPTTTPPPSVGADPDGEVEISWDSGSRSVFSVSVGPTGRLTYAGLFGMNKSYGTEWLGAEIPRAILDNMARVFGSR